MRKKNN